MLTTTMTAPPSPAEHVGLSARLRDRLLPVDRGQVVLAVARLREKVRRLESRLVRRPMLAKTTLPKEVRVAALLPAAPSPAPFPVAAQSPSAMVGIADYVNVPDMAVILGVSQTTARKMCEGRAFAGQIDMGNDSQRKWLAPRSAVEAEAAKHPMVRRQRLDGGRSYARATS